jgi:large subunit ribosomal protein L25
VTDREISVVLEERTVMGKGVKSLRREGKVPAVIHDHGKDSLHVMGDYRPMVKLYSEAGKHHPVELLVGDKKRLALIKDVDFEPVKHELRHVVFQAIKQNEKVTAEIPVALTGEDIPALKVSLIILTQTDTVQVEAFPKDLPDSLEVDATVLAEVGDRLTVADLKVPEGVVVLTDADHVIATVEMPKDQLAEANAAAAELAAESAQAEGTEAAGEPAAEEKTEEQEK